MIPVDGIMDKIDEVVHTRKDRYEMQENFQQFDYTSTDPIQNLGIVFLLLVGLLFFPIVLKLVDILSGFSEKAIQAVARFK